MAKSATIRQPQDKEETKLEQKFPLEYGIAVSRLEAPHKSPGQKLYSILAARSWPRSRTAIVPNRRLFLPQEAAAFSTRKRLHVERDSFRKESIVGVCFPRKVGCTSRKLVGMPVRMPAKRPMETPAEGPVEASAEGPRKPLWKSPAGILCRNTQQKPSQKSGWKPLAEILARNPGKSARQKMPQWGPKWRSPGPQCKNNNANRKRCFRKTPGERGLLNSRKAKGPESPPAIRPHSRLF